MKLRLDLCAFRMNVRSESHLEVRGLCSVKNHTLLSLRNVTGKEGLGVPTVVQQVKNLTGIHEEAGLIPGFA